jgi:TRAP transporter TAXI family solute receptor
VVGVAEATALGHWVVSRASGIKSLMDLAGKRFAPGPVGTVTREVNTALLTKLGILDKIKVANVSHGEMVSYLKDGKLDGFALIGSVPIPAVTEAVVSGDVRLLDIGKELDASGFLKANPFLRKAPIPAGTYPRIDEPATTYAENGIFVVNKDVPDAVVYKITKTLWGKACLDYLPKADRALAQMKEDPLVGLIFPLHPGAARYWKEAGRDVSGVPTPDRAGM